MQKSFQARYFSSRRLKNHHNRLHLLNFAPITCVRWHTERDK